MIGGAIDRQGWGIQFMKNRSHVGIELRLNFRDQEWFAVFGAENEVDENGGERLGHEEDLGVSDLFRPVGA
jgi:hypothetical protein